MRISNKLLRLLPVVPCVFLSACSDDVESTLSGYAFGSYVRIVCDDAEFQKRHFDLFFSDLPDATRVPIEMDLEGAKSRCAALSPIWASVADSHERLNEGIYWPETAYLFVLKVSEDDHRAVGFFDSKADCGKAMELIQKIGYDTRPCYRRTLFWKVVWSFGL